jgi:hypothetical protein
MKIIYEYIKNISISVLLFLYHIERDLAQIG